MGEPIHRLVVVQFSYSVSDEYGPQVNAPNVRCIEGSFEQIHMMHNAVFDALNTIGIPYPGLTPLDKQLAYEVIDGRKS